MDADRGNVTTHLSDGLPYSSTFSNNDAQQASVSTLAHLYDGTSAETGQHNVCPSDEEDDERSSDEQGSSNKEPGRRNASPSDEQDDEKSSTEQATSQNEPQLPQLGSDQSPESSAVEVDSDDIEETVRLDSELSCPPEHEGQSQQLTEEHDDDELEALLERASLRAQGIQPPNQTGLLLNRSDTDLRWHGPALMARLWRYPGSPVQGDFYALLRGIILEVDTHVAPVKNWSKLRSLHRDFRERTELQGLELIASMPEQVIEGLMHGDLAERWLNNVQNLRDKLTRFRHGPAQLSAVHDDIPCIYLNVVVNDKTGKGMLRAHVRQMCEEMWCLTKPTLTANERKFLQELNEYWLTQANFAKGGFFKYKDIFEASTSATGTAEDKRLAKSDVVHTFLSSLQKRESLLGDSNATMAIPEIGLTQKASSRLTQHAIFVNTPLLLTLVRSYVGRTFPGVYAMWQFVLVYVNSHWKLSMGEALISNLASSYMTTGGCNEVQGGMSDSSGGLPQKRWIDIAEKMHQRKLHGTYIQNIKRYDAMEEFNKRHQEEVRAAEERGDLRAHARELEVKVEQNRAKTREIVEAMLELRDRFDVMMDKVIRERNELIRIYNKWDPEHPMDPRTYLGDVYRLWTEALRSPDTQRNRQLLLGWVELAERAHAEIWPMSRDQPPNAPQNPDDEILSDSGIHFDFLDE